MSTPLRIALISEHASPLAALGGTDAGGQNVYVAHVAQCLARSGHQVDVFTRREDTRTPTIVDVRPGFRVMHLTAGPPAPCAKETLLPHMSAFTEAAVQLFRHSVPYDAIHANFFMSALAGLRLRAAFDVPLVVTFHALGLVRREHQGSADGFPAERVAIEREVVRRAERIVGECPQDCDDLARLYGAESKRLAMVPCGVDLQRFGPGSRTQARRRLGLADDDFVVLQLGRMVPRKGVDNVIRAVARLGSRLGRRARLLVVGGNSADPHDGATPEIDRLRQLSRECGAQDAVTFVGQRQRDELPDHYRAADVFVSTPWYEPFGITPLEAMACGTPVIGSAVGGIRYSVVDGVTGYLVPPNDPAALAVALERLRDQPALAAALGRAGMHRVRSRFTWERVAGQLAGVYRDAIAEHGAPVHRRPALQRLVPTLA